MNGAAAIEYCENVAPASETSESVFEPVFNLEHILPGDMLFFGFEVCDFFFCPVQDQDLLVVHHRAVAGVKEHHKRANVGFRIGVNNFFSLF